MNSLKWEEDMTVSALALGQASRGVTMRELLGGYTVDAGLRDRAYLFILRYDFKTHSLTYYTTVEGDAPQGGIVDLYIP